MVDCFGLDAKALVSDLLMDAVECYALEADFAASLSLEAELCLFVPEPTILEGDEYEADSDESLVGEREECSGDHLSDYYKFEEEPSSETTFDSSTLGDSGDLVLGQVLEGIADVISMDPAANILAEEVLDLDFVRTQVLDEVAEVITEDIFGSSCIEGVLDLDSPPQRESDEIDLLRRKMCALLEIALDNGQFETILSETRTCQVNARTAPEILAPVDEADFVDPNILRWLRDASLARSPFSRRLCQQPMSLKDPSHCNMLVQAEPFPLDCLQISKPVAPVLVPCLAHARQIAEVEWKNTMSLQAVAEKDLGFIGVDLDSSTLHGESFDEYGSGSEADGLEHADGNDIEEFRLKLFNVVEEALENGRLDEILNECGFPSMEESDIPLVLCTPVVDEGMDNDYVDVESVRGKMRSLLEVAWDEGVLPGIFQSYSVTPSSLLGNDEALTQKEDPPSKGSGLGQNELYSCATTPLVAPPERPRGFIGIGRRPHVRRYVEGTTTDPGEILEVEALVEPEVPQVSFAPAIPTSPKCTRRRAGRADASITSPAAVSPQPTTQEFSGIPKPPDLPRTSRPKLSAGVVRGLALTPCEEKELDLHRRPLRNIRLPLPSVLSESTTMTPRVGAEHFTIHDMVSHFYIGETLSGTKAAIGITPKVQRPAPAGLLPRLISGISATTAAVVTGLHM